MNEPTLPDSFDECLSKILREGDSKAVPPEWLEGRLYNLLEPALPRRRRQWKRQAVVWATSLLLALAFVLGGPLRDSNVLSLVARVEAAVQRVQSAVIERETLDHHGQVVARSTSRYADHKWRIEQGDRLVLTTPTFYWELDHEEKRVTERLRAAASGPYPDRFNLPEIRQALADPNAAVQTNRAFSAAGLMSITVQTSEQERQIFGIEPESKLPVAWITQVRLGDRWRTTSRGSARYNVDIDARLFKPVTPMGYQEGLSIREQEAILDRLRESAVRERLGPFTITLRDAFLNREGDLFVLMSFPKELLQRLYELRLVGSEAARYVEVPSTVAVATDDSAMAPEPLYLEGQHGAVIWWSPLPGNQLSDSARFALEFGPLADSAGEELNASERRIRFDLDLRRSHELLPDWMDMTSTPLSRSRYRLDRGIALGDRLTLESPKEALEQYDSALAVLLSQPNPRQALAWEGKAKALRALRRHRDALECARRAFNAAGNDVATQQRLRNLFPDL